jgi:hypothetical protein
MPFPENANAKQIELPASIRDTADHIAAPRAPAPKLRSIVVQLPQPALSGFERSSARAGRRSSLAKPQFSCCNR